VELGGTDQKFNLMRGRDLQRHFGQPQQIVLMMPIIEGLDGVQKMSKSLGNAIGVHEPAGEMYGKLMSISDELMWRYWTLLTDLRASEIEKMRADVTSGALHPMEAKKQLARTIVGGFWGAEAAQTADENWARQFQQKSDDVEGLEEVRIPYGEIAGAADGQIRVGKLLVRAGLAASGAEATRKLAEKAVRIDGEIVTEPGISVGTLPARMSVRVGKRARVAVVE
jgi:tyrosyl-tRNA synthetase